MAPCFSGSVPLAEVGSRLDVIPTVSDVFRLQVASRLLHGGLEAWSLVGWEAGGPTGRTLEARACRPGGSSLEALLVL